MQIEASWLLCCILARQFLKYNNKSLLTLGYLERKASSTDLFMMLEIKYPRRSSLKLKFWNIMCSYYVMGGRDKLNHEPLPCEPEGLTSIPRGHIKKPDVLVRACCPSAGCVEAGRFLGLDDQTALWYRFQAMERLSLRHQGNQWVSCRTIPKTDLWPECLTCASILYTLMHLYTQSFPQDNIQNTKPNKPKNKTGRSDRSGDKGLAMKMSKLALRPPDPRVWDSWAQEVELEDAWAMMTN